MVKHSGIATGNLALSKDQLGDVMADMLRDIESSKTGAASEVNLALGPCAVTVCCDRVL